MPHQLPPSHHWAIYILSCGDGTLYTGSSNDISRRVAQHNQGLGAKYTRARLPVELRYVEYFPDRSTACKRESEIKKMTRLQKMNLLTRTSAR